MSVIMPIRNEAPHLRAAVEAVLSQEYPRPFDVCLAVAPSDDGTEAIANELSRSNDRVSVVENPAGVTPAGLNAAIRATDGEVVVRVDGHARLSEGYVRRAVETMARTGAVNVGGIQNAVGHTPFEQAVAAAQTSRLGTGGARYRVGGEEGPVDTVYLGVFRRTEIEAVGLFDERLIRNQDYELNIRLRKAGGAVWFDPALSVEYRPRGSLTALAKQYFEYGWWKAEVARRHPDSLRARQVAPVVLLTIVSWSLVSSRRRRRWLLIPSTYVLIGAGGSRSASEHQTPMGLLVTPTMHLSWAIGFVAACMASARRQPPRTPQS